MQFYFHVLYDNNLEYDRQGQHFPNLDLARESAIGAIRTFFLIHPDPRPETIAKSIVCISDDKGDILDRIPFPQAFRSGDGPSDMHYAPGHA